MDMVEKYTRASGSNRRVVGEEEYFAPGKVRFLDAGRDGVPFDYDL